MWLLITNFILENTIPIKYRILLQKKTSWKYHFQSTKALQQATVTEKETKPSIIEIPNKFWAYTN